MYRKALSLHCLRPLCGDSFVKCQLLLQFLSRIQMSPTCFKTVTNFKESVTSYLFYFILSSVPASCCGPDLTLHRFVSLGSLY